MKFLSLKNPSLLCVTKNNPEFFSAPQGTFWILLLFANPTEMEK